MTIGATEGKEPNHIHDEDLRTPEQLRGDMRAIHKARMSLNEKASVEGLIVKIDLLEQQLKMTHEQIQALINHYGNHEGRLNNLETARVTDLNVRINGGSTTPEDIDGLNS